MKKIFIALLFLLTFGGYSIAQTTPKAKAKTSTTANKAPTTKKDGTPDKRFKANKTTTPPVHTKKDGTADKRFKENKK
ncbi:MAG: hypothetical protein Q8918_15430 [Bacteroidota bacterium]|nr:hypothetical protein [Bacteroidota bacterium]